METTPPIQPQYPMRPPKKQPYVLWAVGALVLLVLIAAAVWFALPFFQEKITVYEGQKREGYLKQLPDNPAAANLTFEERQRILAGDGAQ